MLLIDLTINGTVHRISNEMLILEYPYLPKINTFTSPKMSAPSSHGGYCKISYGKVSFFPDLFEDSWPPPKSLDMIAYYRETILADNQRLFYGTIFLTGTYSDRVEYNFFDIGVGRDVNVLEAIVSYVSGTDNVVVPMVFGDVKYFEALRLPNYSGYYNFHDAYLTSTYTVWDDGAGLDITSNAIKVAGSNSFYLNPNPVGTVTISGTSSKATTLNTLLVWAANEMGLVGIISSLNYATGVKKIRREITSQITVVDFLDEVLQYFGCLSFDAGSGGFIYVSDMDYTSEAYTRNEYNSFGSTISHNAPIEKVTINSIVRAAQTDPVTVTETSASVEVKSGYSYANNEMSLESQTYYPIVDQIDATRLIDIQSRPLLSITVPMELPLAYPGRYYSWDSTTDAYLKAMHMNVRASNITYNFDRDEVQIQGDGFYDYVGDKIWMIPQQSATVGEIVPMLRIDPSNGNISQHYLPGGSDTSNIDYRNGCVDDNDKIWPAPWGNSDYSYMDTVTGLKQYVAHSQGVDSAYINTVNGTGTDYVFYVPYTSPDITRLDTSDLSFLDQPHSKSVTNGAYLCGAYCNDLLWLAGGSHANITSMNPTTFTLVNYPHGRGIQAYSGGVAVGTKIWWCPKNSNYVTLQDATNGSLTHHLLSVYTTNDLFNGVVHDGTDLWFLPGSASASIYKFSLTSYDVTTIYDSGYSNGTFNGGVYYDGFIWLAPETGDDIIKIDLSDGAVTAYAHGLSNSSSLYFIGAILTTE